MKHELLLLSVARATFLYVAATSASSAATAAAFASPNLSLSSLASHEISLPPLSSHLLPSLQSFLSRRSHRICSLWRLFHLISTRSLSSSRNHLKFQFDIDFDEFCRFSLKKGGRDGDDGTEEVIVLTLVEKSTLSTLQRASLVEKSRQKPSERMRVLSDVRCYSKF
ncbi:hypothetical protein AHAS_Ahas04G0204400 [Arachis hypogaea]